MKLKIWFISMLFVLIISLSASAEYIVGDVVNLRKKPNLNSKIIDTLNFGDEVSIIKTKGDWYKVQTNDYIGFVHKDYVKDTLTELGEWHITAYTWTGSPCANGNYPTSYYTIACNSLPFGTRVYIQDVGVRVVEDRGPDYLGSAWCDVYMDSVSECVAWGSQYKKVYLLEE